MAIDGRRDRGSTRGAARGFETDFVILGTGFTVDPPARPELGDFADTDRDLGRPLHAAAGGANRGARRVSLARRRLRLHRAEPGTRALAREPSTASTTARRLSLGKVSGDIPAISEGAHGWRRASPPPS